MAMDMGGSNVRVTKYQLKGNGLLEIVKEVRRAFPESYMMGTADQVFGFLAKCVQDVLPNPGIKFGFTFSFPCSQTSINRSTIVEWTKGFSASGCIGNDPALMLEECLRQRGIDLHVTAICNDTVGTLISRSYWDPKTAVGIILGTGCNAAYIEDADRLTKIDIATRTGKMIINMECGAIGTNRPTILPQLPFDIELDPTTPNPGRQYLEKMMSGYYLGELSRLWAIDMYKKRLLFTDHDGKSDFFDENLPFDYKYCSIILGDITEDLEETKRILIQYGIKDSTKEDRQMLKRIVYHIIRRSARLMGTLIHAIYTHMGEEYRGKTVGIEGSVYKCVPHYQDWVHEALTELGREDIMIGYAEDGSCIGAALIAYNTA